MKINKKTLAINLLAVFLAVFIVMFSVFTYKYYNLKGQLDGQERFTILKGIDENDELFYEKIIFENEIKTLEQVLESTGDFEMTSSSFGAFVTGVGGIQATGNQWWSLSSSTHSSCKGEEEQACAVGVSELFLMDSNQFEFTLLTY